MRERRRRYGYRARGSRGEYRVEKRKTIVSGARGLVYKMGSRRGGGRGGSGSGGRSKEGFEGHFTITGCGGRRAVGDEFREQLIEI